MKNILLIAFILLVISCSEDCKDQGNCRLLPDAGPCEAAIPMYFFDHEENRCKEFLWGGCDGVVPFENLEACQAECNCN